MVQHKQWNYNKKDKQKTDIQFFVSWKSEEKIKILHF